MSRTIDTRFSLKRLIKVQINIVKNTSIIVDKTSLMKTIRVIIVIVFFMCEDQSPKCNKSW